MQNFEFMRYILPILLVLSICISSCNDPDDNTIVSSDARVSTFTFQPDTANPSLTTAVYKIEHRTDTGLITSKDSLRYGTRLDSVVPLVTYMATPGIVNFVLPDTTITSTGIDTINFNQKPIYLQVIASDMETEKWYLIDIAAHQSDPNLYVWSCLTENIFSPNPIPNCETKAFYWQDKLIVFVNNGLSTTLYQSVNGVIWSPIEEPIDMLPVPCHVRDILQHHDTLFYIDNHSLYTSTDLVTWSKTDYSTTSCTPINMLMSYDNKAWAILQDTTTQQLLLGIITGHDIIPQTNIEGLNNGYLPSNFPISDFAALSFSSSSERPRAMVVGGRANNGDMVNSRWNLEYVRQQGYRLKDFSIAQPSFESLIGVSIIQYNHQLIMFGGTDNDLAMRSDILYSDDEGMNWYLPDSTSNRMPSTYQPRTNQTVLIDSDENIYIIGGQSQNRSFGDVYCGFLNSKKWD